MPSIKAGTVADFADSLAAAMENALRQEYEAVKEVPMPEAPDQDRHMLFVAIAQGVVRYLKDNTDAFTVEVQTVQDDSLIESEGGGITVTQLRDEEVADGDNRVTSTGDATLEIQTRGTLY